MFIIPSDLTGASAGFLSLLLNPRLASFLPSFILEFLEVRLPSLHLPRVARFLSFPADLLNLPLLSPVSTGPRRLAFLPSPPHGAGASRAEAAGWLRVGAKPRTVHIIKGAKFESWLLEVRSCNQTGKLWPSLNICISYFPVMSSLARDLMRSEACLIKASVNFARLGY